MEAGSAAPARTIGTEHAVRLEAGRASALLAEDADVSCLGALMAGFDLKLNTVALVEFAVTIHADDGGVMAGDVAAGTGRSGYCRRDDRRDARRLVASHQLIRAPAACRIASPSAPAAHAAAGAGARSVDAAQTV